MNDKVPCSSTKLIRGGTAYSSSPFELNPQLHGQVSNPYSFGIKQNYKSSATTKVSVPPYTEKSWTTPGTYTWTVPAGVTRIRVAVCGGGGGCVWGNEDGTRSGNNGGDSKFSDLIVATAGKGGSVYDVSDYHDDTATGGKGGTPNGNDGVGLIAKTNITAEGGKGFSLNFNKTTGNYGKGGSNTSKNYGAWTAKASGGSGGYDSSYLSITPNKVYSITVGIGGKSYIGNSDSQYITNYTNGNSGFVLIAYGEGIE